MKYMHPSREASSGVLASRVRIEKNTLKRLMLFRGQKYPMAEIRPLRACMQHLHRQGASQRRWRGGNLWGAVEINFVCLLHYQCVWINFHMQVIMLIFGTKKERIIINLAGPAFSNAVFLLAGISAELLLGFSVFLPISMQVLPVTLQNLCWFRGPFFKHLTLTALKSPDTDCPLSPHFPLNESTFSRGGASHRKRIDL